MHDGRRVGRPLDDQQTNALGLLIEARFNNRASPCRSYTDLERHSGISREALSRYVTARPDRRRSLTLRRLVAIAEAMHLSLESVIAAAVASEKGVPLLPETQQWMRIEVLRTLVAALTDEQFSVIVELLRHLGANHQARPEQDEQQEEEREARDA